MMRNLNYRGYEDKYIKYKKKYLEFIIKLKLKLNNHFV